MPGQAGFDIGRHVEDRVGGGVPLGFRDRQHLGVAVELVTVPRGQHPLAEAATIVESRQGPALVPLLRHIAGSADDTHDAVPDKKPASIPADVAKLPQAWGQFSQHVRTCSGIEY